MGQRNLFSFFKNIRSLVLVSLFVALYAVFSLFAIYITNELRFNFTFMPVAWSSVLFGPVAGGVTGVLGDVLGWMVRTEGPFLPGLTFSAFVSGIIYGIFLYNKEITVIRVLFAAITMIVVVEIGLNTLWLMILYGSAFKALIAGRLIKALILLPVQVFVLHSTGHLLKRISPVYNRI